eukprot:CAMPEP_0183347340 /NCGR_PEP_ID=MMETSP0164_2-20130417/12187_1 /TAXON_ID=221442 /ORGANISM="Coccolithus pelagicus ssp braarudi, Strain PLY182g" /LENGTH=123 /DNA_ID=CAMNT_0025518741 /DNA_START=52 /DNA_END=423 /DNA_ORIENTATION=+
MKLALIALMTANAAGFTLSGMPSLTIKPCTSHISMQSFEEYMAARAAGGAAPPPAAAPATVPVPPPVAPAAAAPPTAPAPAPAVAAPVAAAPTAPVPDPWMDDELTLVTIMVDGVPKKYRVSQ